MRKLLFASFILLAGFKTFGQTNIPATEAAKHINEKAIVCDKIYGGKFLSNANLTFLNVGGNHPNELLTLLIKGDDRKKFKTPPEEMFKDKKVCITGTIIDYKGKPEMIITDPDQLKLAE